jgi:hypothetical protein
VGKLSIGTALAAVLVLWAGTGVAAPADDLRTLLEQGRSADAYALGKKNDGELGKPDFDFYFGIAAVDTGNAGEGVLALERYIIQFPDNDRARLELARGYFVLGELVRAREEFEAVSRRNPPPSVQATIDRFMDSIRSQETRYTTTATGYVEIGGGYDTNANSGLGNPVLAIPALGFTNITVAATGLKKRSAFYHLGAGGQVAHPIAPGVSLLGGVSFEGKMHDDNFAKQFDQSNYGGFGGLSWLKNKDLFRFTASLSKLEVDYKNTSAR